ncbi:hypothetical protein [Stenotrophomonas sp.]|uniref:hypothetical protein n=1 Tax=Stenotrophomonas sp. TaxID=69392 RepID=UPI0031CEA7F1
MVTKWVIAAVLGWLALGALMFSRYPADLSAPRLWRRYFNRAVLYPWFHLIAFGLVMHLGKGLSALRPGLGDGLQGILQTGTGALLLPFPLAVVLMTLPVRLQRVLRGGRWQPGLGPEPPPVVPAPAPLRPRSKDYGTVDLHDPAMIQEVARAHWQAMDAAADRGLGLEYAVRLQRGFLRFLLLHDDRALAEQAASIYRRAMIAHAWDGQRARGL